MTSWAPASIPALKAARSAADPVVTESRDALGREVGVAGDPAEAREVLDRGAGGPEPARGGATNGACAGVLAYSRPQ